MLDHKDKLGAPFPWSLTEAWVAGKVRQRICPILPFEGKWVTPPPSTSAGISSDIQFQGSGILSIKICFLVFLPGICDVSVFCDFFKALITPYLA